jgi:hypothetical protein
MARKTNKHSAKAKKKKQRKEAAEKKREKAAQKRRTALYKKYATFAAVAVIAIFLIKDIYTVEAGDPVFEIPVNSINLGSVSVAGGQVVTEFEIKNTGGGRLLINDMETSCGCTSASIIYDEVEGPLFNMRDHGTNPKNWIVEIAPGDTASLRVYYDPAVHADLRGPVTRIITVYSNAPVGGVKEAYIKINQVD